MTSKDALRKLILDDFTPMNDLVYRKGQNIQIVEPMYLGISPQDCYNIILKDLEVLTILHDKEVVLECVKATDNYKDYIRAVQRIYGNVNIDITEQEYNLLKRWLEDEKQ